MPTKPTPVVKGKKLAKGNTNLPPKGKGAQGDNTRLIAELRVKGLMGLPNQEEFDRIKKYNQQKSKFSGNASGVTAATKPYTQWRATPQNQQSILGKQIVETPTQIGGLSVKPTWYGAESYNKIGSKPRASYIHPALIADRLARDVINGDLTVADLITQVKNTRPKSTSGESMKLEGIIRVPRIANEWFKESVEGKGKGSSVGIRIPRSKGL